MAPPSAFAGLSIRVLGELSLTRDGVALVLPPSKKTRALLSYLVLTEREHQRERLCSLLWDVADDPRGALRWSISKLRALCDEPAVTRIVTDRAAIGFCRQGAAVDLLTVRARVAEGALERMSCEDLEQLALEFRGELLAGLALEGFDELQSWLVAEREQARLLHATLLRALVRSSASPERALLHARALVRVDPLSQSARASLIEQLGQLGLEAELEQQYQVGRRLLGELALSVSPELEEVYRRARRAARALQLSSQVRSTPSAEPPALVCAGEVPLPVTSGEAIPFVGRTREQAALRALLAETGKGRARVVLLSGEAGVGKSRLATELVAEASRRQAAVLVGQAYEVESGRPYGPWIDALRQVPRALVGSRLAAELTMLVPEWAPEHAARSSEEQLFGAVCELLAARAHSAPPVLLLLDDVHWLDESSCRLLHYVARFSRHRPLLVLLTARDGELFDNAAVSRVLRSLRRDGLLAELAIGPLSPREITELAEHLRAGGSAERIHAESAGNALFAIELARAVAGGAGPGGNASSGVESSEAEALSGTLSGTLSALIRDRVEALPAAVAEALRWAAVLGSGFAAERVELVSGLAADEVATALETLQRHALLQARTSTQPAGAAYVFSHEVVRRAVYAELSEPRRRVMHRRVAERLEPLLAGDEALAADVVHHAALAGKPEVSVRACLCAAERCVKLFASKDAEALVRRGFYHARQLPAVERVKLELELWRVQIDARRPLQSEAVGEELQRLAALALDHGSEDAARLAFHLLSWLRWEANATSEALAFSLRAEALSRNLTDRERSTALGEAARCLALVDGDLGVAEALLLEAEARAGRSGVLPSVIPDARGMLAWHRGELRAAASSFAQARQQARHDVERGNEFQALEHELGVLLELEELVAARAIASELAELASKLRGGSEAPVARVLAALLDYLEEPGRREVTLDERAGTEPEGAEVELDAALAALRLADVKQRLAFAQLHAAEKDLKHGRMARAATRATEALGAALALSRCSDSALARSVLAQAACAGEQGEALATELAALLATPRNRLSERARRAAENAMGQRPAPASRAIPHTKGERTNGNRRGRTPIV